MTVLIRDLLRERATFALVAAVVAIIATRGRFASWCVCVAPLFLWLVAEAGRFDGQRHVTPKFDATAFVWISAVELRAAAGVAIVALAIPLGVRAGRLVDVRHGWLAGLAALGPFGAGLILSSVGLVRAASDLLADDSMRDTDEAVLRAAVGHSHACIALGTALSVLACLFLAVALVRGKLAQ